MQRRCGRCTRVGHSTQRCGSLIEPTPTEPFIYLNKFDCIPQYESISFVGTITRAKKITEIDHYSHDHEVSSSSLATQQLDCRKSVYHLLQCLNIFVITKASVLATHARLSKAICARLSLCPLACSYADLHCTLTDPEPHRKIGIYTVTNRTNNYNKRRGHAIRRFEHAPK